MKKIVLDWKKLRPDILNDFIVTVFTKSDKVSITIYEDVVEYVTALDKQVGGLEELIVIGFSSGGVVASHIVGNLSQFTFKKKIITYDTPWQVMDNVRAFQQKFLRLDIMFFAIVMRAYRNHFNYNEIKTYLDSSPGILYGADAMISMIKKIHNFSDAEMFRVTGFNMKQSPCTKIFNISSKYDPVVVRSTHNSFVQTYGSLGSITFVKNVQGHCSDLAFSTAYLQELMYAIDSI